MTGDDLFTYQLPGAIDECKPYLVFSQLVTAEMDSTLTELGDALKAESGEAEAEKVVADWLAEQVAKYGEMFAMKPIPTDAHEVRNPIAEAVEMMGGPEKAIVVRT